MANLHGHEDDISQECQEAVIKETADLPNNDSAEPPDVPLSQSMAQIVLDRLHASLEQKPADSAPPLQHQTLEQLGQGIRQWRLKWGYTRQEMADKLRLDVNQLLCLEHGLGVPADITEAQLQTLSSLLQGDELDRSLAASLKP